MAAETLQSALEREHREIDGGIETYLAGLEHPDAPAEPLIRAVEALRRHIYLEEEFLFPPLRVGCMTMPIMVMLREHGEIWRTMDALSALVTEEADADRVRDAGRDLLAQLDRHNSKEEPVIYSVADSSLTAEARADLARFIETGRMPQGWTCQRAQA